MNHCCRALQVPCQHGPLQDGPSDGVHWWENTTAIAGSGGSAASPLMNVKGRGITIL